MTSWCSVRPTSYGGRGVFATQRIPKGTLVHTCPKPYASVIYRVFRREVCAQCFSYAFDAGRNTWNVKNDAQPGSGVWFCREACRDTWLEEENSGGLVGEMNIVVDKAMKRMKAEDKSSKLDPNLSLATSIANWRPEEITAEIINLVWKRAEDTSIKPGLNDVQFLEDLELDTARFLISGIIQRAREENSNHSRASTELFSWNALLELQNSELHYIRQKPYMLASHIRVYRFLRQVLIPALRPYVETSEIVRSILGRDPGNVFGLWEMSTSIESEMLGWGMYISASYFNHDCEPNVKKDRVGRSYYFRTIRDIEPNEELVINYIDLTDPVTERRDQLQKNWYFPCSCKRCEMELIDLVTPIITTKVYHDPNQSLQRNGTAFVGHRIDEDVVPGSLISQ